MLLAKWVTAAKQKYVNKNKENVGHSNQRACRGNSIPIFLLFQNISSVNLINNAKK
jgi:hypothetical protein